MALTSFPSGIGWDSNPLTSWVKFAYHSTGLSPPKKNVKFSHPMTSYFSFYYSRVKFVYKTITFSLLYTVCYRVYTCFTFTKLDDDIFESILTTFWLYCCFWGSWGSAKHCIKIQNKTQPGITQYHWIPAKLYFFHNMNFVVVILDSLFKTGKSGTQWCCVISGTFSVP